MKEKVTILIDSREPSHIPPLFESLGAEVAVGPFLVDYIIAEGIVVERKEVKDFVASIYDKRLWEQLGAISSSEKIKKGYLLIEGNLLRTRAKLNVILGTLTSILIKYPKIQVIQTPNINFTCQFLYKLSEKLQNADNGKKIHSIRPKEKISTLKDAQKFFLEGLRGVGGTLAERILEKYKPIDFLNLIITNPEEIDVLGISGKIKKGVQITLLGDDEK